MQIQKHLFRIAERALKSNNAPLYWGAILIFCLGLSVFYSIAFIVGNFSILPSNNQLSKCFQKALSIQQNGFKIQNDAIYIVFQKDIDLPKLTQARIKKQVVTDNQICLIIKNLNTTGINYRPFEFTWTPNVLYFDTTDRHLYRFINYTIKFKQSSTFRHLIYGMNTLLANQLITDPLNIFQENPFIRSSSISLNTPLPLSLDLTAKIIRILKSIFYYFIISIVTSLYIYGTIIAAPAVIMSFLKCSNFARNGGNMTQVYKIFPWIGMHSLIRQTSQNQTIKNKSGQICKSIIFYFFFLYLVYYAIVLQVSLDIFYQKTQQGLQQMIFGYIALIQFCSKVFMRTRPFLKYYPKIHTMLMVIFIVYCQFVPFGFKKIVCMIVCMLSAALFSYMVLKLEIPGQTVWERNRKYTPTIDRPRIGLLPLFNVSWINNLPDQWTLLYPLFGRASFAQRQLALVDRNFQELDQMFAQNNQQPIPEINN